MKMIVGNVSAKLVHVFLFHIINLVFSFSYIIANIAVFDGRSLEFPEKSNDFYGVLSYYI